MLDIECQNRLIQHSTNINKAVYVLQTRLIMLQSHKESDEND